MKKGPVRPVAEKEERDTIGRAGATGGEDAREARDGGKREGAINNH